MQNIKIIETLKEDIKELQNLKHKHNCTKCFIYSKYGIFLNAFINEHSKSCRLTRIYNSRLAEEITKTGRLILEKIKLNTVYGDSESIFIIKSNNRNGGIKWQKKKNYYYYWEIQHT